MYRNLLLCLCLLLALLGTATAENKQPTPKNPTIDKSTAGEPAVKQLSGMSVVGNDEAPTSLYIVPWKKSELGSETNMNKMLTESAAPVEQGEFMRQLDLYEIRKRK
jgi:hypothetical protein